MGNQQTVLTKRSIDTPSGRISYTEAGSGPMALFVHGVVLNKHVWRRQLTGLSDMRRCIAVDLLAHGDTAIDPNHDVSVTANANICCARPSTRSRSIRSTWSATIAAAVSRKSSRRRI